MKIRQSSISARLIKNSVKNKTAKAITKISYLVYGFFVLCLYMSNVQAKSLGEYGICKIGLSSNVFLNFSWAYYEGKFYVNTNRPKYVASVEFTPSPNPENEPLELIKVTLKSSKVPNDLIELNKIDDKKWIARGIVSTYDEKIDKNLIYRFALRNAICTIKYLTDKSVEIKNNTMTEIINDLSDTEMLEDEDNEAIRLNTPQATKVSVTQEWNGSKK
ncbi:MAG: hypothetical protein K0R49_962 [Burkholderiales bacterium]|jgi:hypothetical protein|nr:hypothetical protein [Burkholderiales bacterium]